MAAGPGMVIDGAVFFLFFSLCCREAIAWIVMECSVVCLYGLFSVGAGGVASEGRRKAGFTLWWLNVIVSISIAVLPGRMCRFVNKRKGELV